MVQDGDLVEIVVEPWSCYGKCVLSVGSLTD